MAIEQREPSIVADVPLLVTASAGTYYKLDRLALMIGVEPEEVLNQLGKLILDKNTLDDIQTMIEANQ